MGVSSGCEGDAHSSAVGMALTGRSPRLQSPPDTQRSLLGSQDARQPPCGWLSCYPSRLVTSGASKTVVLYVFRSTVTAGKSRSGHPWWGGHDLCHIFINFLLLIKREFKKTHVTSFKSQAKAETYKKHRVLSLTCFWKNRSRGGKVPH